MIEASVLGWVFGIGVPLIYLLGVAHAVDAIMNARTPQGSTAWAIALVTVPYIALPLYWVFGRFRFDAYRSALRSFDELVESQIDQLRKGPLFDLADVRRDDRGELRAFQALSSSSFSRGNDATLLVDGETTFDAIFTGIESARSYVLAQFYIIHDDTIGGRFKDQLIRKAKEGVRVYLLYDGIGCAKLPRRYRNDLEDAGVEIAVFTGGRKWPRRLRLNFRNHRKIVAVDGTTAFVGGLNVGDEYLGRDRKLSPWRDTHLRIEGPIVQDVQVPFLRDWFFIRRETLDVNWEPQRSEKDRLAVTLASGPDDELEMCGLAFMHAIESAEDRVWIASPYFVPDGRIVGALQLAALRGVDVRILMPRATDSVLFKYVPYAYFAEAEKAGVKIFLYEDGFMHQKVFLVDDDYAMVGTANMDNRSFRLNFELTCLINDSAFCQSVAEMLLTDFGRSTGLTAEAATGGGFAFRFATQVTRLVAPVL